MSSGAPSADVRLWHVRSSLAKVTEVHSVVRIAGTVALGVVVVGVGYVVYVGYEGSRQLVSGVAHTHGCLTPATLGWTYEAVNYDIALDAASSDASSQADCSSRGSTRAGSDVVASDGVRVAGWFIPAGHEELRPAPVVVLVHGWGGVDKSDMLRYATILHEDFDIAIVDLRGAGPSDPGKMSLGNLEQRDLSAFLDWLQRVKQPTSIGVLGESGGAATGAKLARTDLRIRALVLESPYARLATMFAQRLRNAGHPGILPTVAAAMVGLALRIGAWPDADPIDVVPVLGRRSLAVSYGRGRHEHPGGRRGPDLPEGRGGRHGCRGPPRPRCTSRQGDRCRPRGLRGVARAVLPALPAGARTGRPSSSRAVCRTRREGLSAARLTLSGGR